MSEKNIEAKETQVGDLFSENFLFNIPIYQRPFSWGEDNFDQLFQDLYDSFTRQEEYFLGSLLLQTCSPKLYDLVDGQQRMTALTILMAVIRDRTSNDDLRDSIQSYIYQKEEKYKRIPEKMRVSPWPEIKELFRQYVYFKGGTTAFLDDFKEGKIRYKDWEDPRYHLWEAIYVFSNKVGDIQNFEDFISHILLNTYMVYIKTTNLTSAFRLFNVLNTRGLPLEVSDILKSENLGCIEDDTVKDKYAAIWRTIEEEQGREELANIVAYIRTILKKEKAKLGMYEEYQRIFKDGLVEKGIKFIDYVKEIAEIYDEKILSAEIGLADPERKNRYKVIVDLMYRFIPFSDWVPPILAFRHKFKSDNYLLDFVLKLEKKVIIEWAAGFSLSERITSLGRTIRMIEKIGDANELINKILVSETDEDHRSRIIDFSNTKEVERYLRSKVDDSRFYGLHGGKFAKYILLRLDMEMWDIGNLPLYPGVVTTEHVLPQTPSEGSEWLRIFNPEQRFEWTNKLGNLVLLSGRKNSRAQNYDFKKKKEIYFKEKGTPFRITQELQDVDMWDAQNLSKRHSRLMDSVAAIFA